MLWLGAAQVATSDFVNADASYHKAIPLAEAAVVRAEGSPKSKATLADIYSGAGRLNTRRSEAATDKAVRVRLCTDANAWYEKSLKIWQELRDHGKLVALNAAKPANVATAMARCSAMLTRNR